jgi:hypothetical protein
MESGVWRADEMKCICTIVVCIYLIASRVWVWKLWSGYIVAAYRVWMLVFWVVHLGLVARLASKLSPISVILFLLMRW